MEAHDYSPLPPPPPPSSSSYTTTASTTSTMAERKEETEAATSTTTTGSSDLEERKCYYKVSLSNAQSFRVHKRYQKLKIIGTGSYGIVCSAVDTFTKRNVAIKKIANLFSNIYDAKRILREVEVNYFLRHHENIVTLHDVMTDPPGSKCFKDMCKYHSSRHTLPRVSSRFVARERTFVTLHRF